MLPGRGPGRGPPRPPGRGAPGRGAPCPWPCPGPLCPEPPWPAPGPLCPGPPGPEPAGRGPLGRGPGTGLRPGWAGRAGAPPSEGTGGTGARGAAGAGLLGPAVAGAVSPAAGASGAAAAGLGAGALGVACGRSVTWGPDAAAAGACGRAGPGRGPGRPPLPSAGRPGTGAPCPCGLLPWALGPWDPNSSFSLRTTGASIVDDAERTNSPISWSLAITALLSTPNSFASSYTRTFATALPLSARLRRAIVADPGQRVLRPASASGSHRRVLIARSSQLIPLSRHCCRFSFDRLTRPGWSWGLARQPVRARITPSRQVILERAGTEWCRLAQRPR